MGLFSILKSIANHPLNSGHKISSIVRFAKWQVGTRLVPGPVVVPYINDSRLIVRRGQIGATGHVYTGLLDFEEMALLLHFLRPGELFVDVGANVGAFTVLAGAVAGCSCICAEPAPATFADLVANIRINGIEQRCRAENAAVGSENGWLKLTTRLDAMNYVIPDGSTGENDGIVEVRVRTLDDIVGEAEPIAIKIDVEGFEKEVIAGAPRTLSKPTLLLVIMEVNYCTGRYGYDGRLLYEKMMSYGFETFRYVPRERRLFRSDVAAGYNVVFIRHAEKVQERLKSAPAFTIQRLGIEV